MREAAIVIVFVLLGFGAHWCYEYGYNTRDSIALREQAELQLLVTKTEAANHESALKIEKNLGDLRAQSYELAEQIRKARFDCEHIGGNFIELYNAGTNPASSL